jgi:hypothetical protein
MAVPRSSPSALASADRLFAERSTLSSRIENFGEPTVKILGPLPFREDEHGNQLDHEDGPDDLVRDRRERLLGVGLRVRSMMRTGISESVAASTTGSNGV